MTAASSTSSKTRKPAAPAPEVRLEAKVRNLNSFLGVRAPYSIVYFRNEEKVRESAPLSRYQACCRALDYNRAHGLAKVQEI